MNKAIVIAALFFVGIAPAHLLAQDSGTAVHKLTLGAYYGEGDYGGTQDTEIAYFPLTYEIAKFPWVFSVTAPFLALKGPGDVFLDTGNVARPDARSDTTISEQGLGDVVLSGSYQFQPIFNDFAFVDFSVKLKLPTANEKEELGTGEFDVSYQLDFYQTVASTTWFSNIGYRDRGKTPLYELSDSAYFSLGAMQQITESSSIGLVYDFREAAAKSSVESHELMPFYSWTPASDWTLMFYTIVGFTNSSADRVVGFQLSHTFP
ncbi:MAG: hypothetical protein RQ899_14245 [Pseudomonadales bacterium]|nr:hypothetical protein [Pseudomonadales bacterium]